MNILSVKNLSKTYPNFVLDNISFDLPQSKIMGLIGVNGAGKTTTLKSMLNLVNPDSGRIEMFGKTFIENEESCKQEIGVVFGGTYFFNHKKLKSITAVTKRFYKNWDDKAYEKYMKAFSLTEDKRLKELSSGMKVKYMLALALSHKARLLILDEPTSGLDPVSRDDILGLLVNLVKTKDISVLFSTHITSDLEKCADHITYIKDGKLLISASKPEFIKSFDHLKEQKDKGDLTLEEIMIRTERSNYDI